MSGQWTTHGEGGGEEGRITGTVLMKSYVKATTCGRLPLPNAVNEKMID